MAWMIGLMIIWSGLLFGGFVLGKPDPRDTRRMPLWTRIGSSGVLVVAGWSWLWIAMDTDAKTYAAAVATGISFCFLGDLVLAQILPVVRRVPVAMALFGLGHLAYILAFIRFGSNYPAVGPWLLIATWIGWVIVGATGWWLAASRGSQPHRLKWPALIYSLLLSCTAGLSTYLAIRDANFILTAIGAGLFLVSDTILGATLFRGCHFHFVHDIIWLTYGPAQMLIVNGVAAAILAVN